MEKHITLVLLITIFYPELGSSVHLSWIKYLCNQVKDMVGIEILYFILKEDYSSKGSVHLNLLFVRLDHGGLSLAGVLAGRVGAGGGQGTELLP
ncbi:hypothetical protein EK904_006378 [Melospiza melodia maxima]|nr:hypothetical protein EK904_006378 [Melospiza melodia maxima]